MAMLNKGVKLSFATTSSSSSYTDLGELYEYPDMGGSVDTIETTNFDSQNKEYIQGLADMGQLEFTLLDDTGKSGSSYVAIEEHEGELLYYKLSIPTAASTPKTYTFPAYTHVIDKGSSANDSLKYGLVLTVAGNFARTVPTASVNK